MVSLFFIDLFPYGAGIIFSLYWDTNFNVLFYQSVFLKIGAFLSRKPELNYRAVMKQTQKAAWHPSRGLSLFFWFASMPTRVGETQKGIIS